MNFNKHFVLDQWNKWHFGLWGALMFLLLFLIKPWPAAGISFLVGIAWEIKDGLAPTWSEWKPPALPGSIVKTIELLWPADGFSWSDLIFDSAGIITGYLLFVLLGGH